MSMGSNTVRAFRPSRYAELDPNDEEDSLVRQANLQRYAVRAAAGLPLFDPPQEQPKTAEPNAA